MNKKLIYNIKFLRLMISIFIFLTPIVFLLFNHVDINFIPPNINLVMTSFISIFVFLLGLQYKLENKDGVIPNFLLLFSIVMLIATILGFVS